MQGVAFAIDGGLLLALVRGLSVAGLLSVFGGLIFLVIVAPRALAKMPVGAEKIVMRLHVPVLASVVAYAMAALLWLVLQTADLADAHGVADTVQAIPLVLSQTEYGRLIILQVVVVVAIAPVLGRRGGRGRQWASVGLATLALVLQTGFSHAAAMAGGPSLLLAVYVLHLVSGGAWVGGLLPLLLVVQAAPPKVGAAAARWFSPLGQCCIAGSIGSAAYQVWRLVGGLQGLLHTAYGWMALVKLALFVVLLGFAAANRYWFAPALLRGCPQHARRVLLRSLALQTGAGVAIVAAAGVLSSLAPPVTM